MKKLIAVLMLFALLAGIAACNKAPAEPEPTPEPTPDDQAIQAVSDTDAETANAEHTPPASSTDAQTAEGDYGKALACKGRPVEELYAAVGQPLSDPTYGPSCLVEGGEDGMLLYDGFYVWTVRTADGETVHEVGLDE